VWGKNTSGQLGNGTTTDTPVPVDVIGLATGVIAVATGGSHSCAVTIWGGAKCWGANGSGQLGNLTLVDSSIPTDSPLLTTGVAAITAGASHTCALMTTDGVKCWGQNTNGQLGNNSTSNSLIPVDALTLTAGVRTIRASGNTSCALTLWGTAKCWGQNSYGQVGNGSTADVWMPFDVLTLAGAVAIGAGGPHGCALTGEGGVRCWGYNGYGQLGDGSTTSATFPGNVNDVDAMVSARATLTTTTLAVGSHSLTAEYSGDAFVEASTSDPSPTWSIATPRRLR